MKKLFIGFIALALTVCLSGCVATPLSDNKNVTDNDSSKIVSSVETSGSEKSSSQEKLNESGIRALMKENINCVRNIFALGSLPTYGPALKDNIYQVDMSVYKNYAEFKNYIKSVYTSEAADMLLNDYPYEGDPMYINADGKLCINMDRIGGKGYYVDWEDYSVKINSCNDEVCDFTLTASIEEPSENPQKEPYNVDATAKRENGKWLLTKLIY